jgi:hypothetical protein
MKNRIPSLIVLFSATAATPVLADVVYDTEDPFGGPFGVIGFDVFECQSVAVRFTPDSTHTLDVISLWLWNNDEGGGTPPLTITLRTHDDEGDGLPSDQILETWSIDMPQTGLFQPILIPFESEGHPQLQAGTHYWVVAESDSAALEDPVWAIAAEDSGISTTTRCDGEWQTPGSGAVPAIVIEGTPIPDGDANNDGSVDVLDLVLVITEWGTCQDPCAGDLNGDGVVNVQDLILVITNWS